MTTEQMIDHLASRGEFSLHRYPDGTWSATVCFPAPKGITAKVSSDYNHSSCYEALRTVIERLDGLKTIVADDSRLIG